MEYVSLGNTGLKVSRICLGCMSYGSSKWRDWVLQEPEALPFFRQALDAGINFFDTADMYSDGASEEVTGRALKKLGVKREQMVIATKVYNPMGETQNERGTSKKHIRHGIDASLKRLGLDYVDLYQIHRHDSTTPMEETLERPSILAPRACTHGNSQNFCISPIDTVTRGLFPCRIITTWSTGKKNGK
jgi:1-deoxyxylulose-5-phosphate synthase